MGGQVARQTNMVRTETTLKERVSVHEQVVARDCGSNIGAMCVHKVHSLLCRDVLHNNLESGVLFDLQET